MKYQTVNVNLPAVLLLTVGYFHLITSSDAQQPPLPVLKSTARGALSFGLSFLKNL